MAQDKQVLHSKRMNIRQSLGRFLVVLPIYGYQMFIRPFLPMACRFEPTCSSYAIEAIQTLGVFKGMGKTIFRLLRCHPWCSGGHDPVIPIISSVSRYKE